MNSTKTVTASPIATVNAPFADALVALGNDRDDVVVLSADLSNYTDVRLFADRFPDRFFQLGMAEQNMMGVAAGLAKTGLLPIVTTYCVFATRRSYEQVALALCTARRSVVIAAFLPGITTPFRATHQGTDDLALMRNIPGMTVLDPFDATEVTAALPAAAAFGGPVYLRGLRGQVSRHLDPTGYQFRIGPAVALRDGSDVGLIGTGLGSEWALEAAIELDAAGITAAVLHVPTVKPIPGAQIVEFAARFPVVVTVENHSRSGGLGTAVAEVLAERGAGPRLHRLGVTDEWPPAGSLAYIRQRLRLDPTGIAGAVCEALDRSTASGEAAR